MAEEEDAAGGAAQEEEDSSCEDIKCKKKNYFNYRTIFLMSTPFQ